MDRGLVGLTVRYIKLHSGKEMRKSKEVRGEGE